MTTYVTICGRCGSPLEQNDIALAIKGSLVDFIGRAVEVETDVCYCAECRVAFLEFAEGGIEAACKRRKEREVNL